jgi:lipid-A-disaccharide synthase
MPTFFLTAAEHSGDALGASLIHALRRRFPDARFVGVGGEKMATAGCYLLSNPVTRSSMLLGPILQARYWWNLLGQIRRELRSLKPDVVVPIDSSGINVRIAKLAKSEGLPVCYYVAPQVWASRPWRVKKIAAAVDTLCCVLPFEEAYFKERKVNGVYVGHPMFDEPAQSGETDPALLDPPLPSGNGPRVAIFPGSRKAEIDKQMPPMLEILSEIKGRFPGVNFVAAAPSEERAWQIRHHLRAANTPVDIRVGHGDAIIRWADLVLTKSGTATLQIARHRKPMVVMYALSWWTWNLAARFIINTPYMALVNVLAGRELVPEYIPFYGSPLPVARECIELLAHPELRERMSRELAELVGPLQPQTGAGGDVILAADRVAAEVAKYVKT